MIRKKIVFILYSYHKNISNRKELKLCAKMEESIMHDIEKSVQ